MTEPSKFLSVAEAAIILGVTTQRVHTMIREGDIDAIRPWPRQVLLNRTNVEAWAAGERGEPVNKTALRRYIIERTEAENISEVSLALMLDLAREFISERRPNLAADTEARDLWCERMVMQIAARPGAPR